MDLTTYLQKKTNSLLLSPSHEQIIPGAILNILWENNTTYILKKIFTLGFYQRKYSIHTLNGYVYQIFKSITPDLCASTLLSSNIAVESLTHTIKGAASLTLPQYGLSLDTNLLKSNKFTIQIDTVQTRIFNNPFIAFDILQKFLDTNSHSQLYQWLYNDFVVTETLYATKLLWKFETSINVAALLNYTKLNNTLQTTLSYVQKDDRTIEISGNPLVPFAARGFWLANTK